MIGHLVYNVTEALSHLRPKIWSLLLNELRQSGSLGNFSSKIKNGLQVTMQTVFTSSRIYLKKITLASLTTVSSESAKWRTWCARVFTSSRAHVLGVCACLRACVLTCVCPCYDEMFYFLTCLRTWCAFLSYLLHISILKFKDSYSEKFVCFVKLNIFLIYILISTYKTIWNQFKGNRKVDRYII